LYYATADTGRVGLSEHNLVLSPSIDGTAAQLPTIWALTPRGGPVSDGGSTPWPAHGAGDLARSREGSTRGISIHRGNTAPFGPALTKWGCERHGDPAQAGRE